MTATRIDGLGELRGAFREVKDDMRQRTSRLMVAAAGGVVRKEARSIAQAEGLRLTGALISNIVIKRDRTPDGLTQYNLGVRHGRAMGKNAQKRLVVGKNGRVTSVYINDPFYWWFLEKGRNVYPGNGRRKRDSVRSRVQATPFIAPALENRRDDALQAMAIRLEKAIIKANQK
jgi:HK97 gp10 family phage protein